MRMRRKKNLEERLSQCGDLVRAPREDDRDFRAAEPKEMDLDAWFGVSRPLELEIGCGKGGFICELAKRRPDTSFLAVERTANVLVEAAEAVQKAGLDNVRFLQCTAEYLPRYLAAGCVQRLYLNFSCPFPKKKYAVHRLTHPRFLDIYKRLLAPGAEIHQKTDNRQLFQCSLEWLSGAGFALKNVSLDLHADDCPDNIVTEYEARFAAQGFPIYRLEAFLPQSPEKR